MMNNALKNFQKFFNNCQELFIKILKILNYNK